MDAYQGKKATIEDMNDVPSEMMVITSSPPTAFNMKSARKRSCNGVDPDVLRSVDRRADIWSGVTVTDMMVDACTILG